MPDRGRRRHHPSRDYNQSCLTSRSTYCSRSAVEFSIRLIIHGAHYLKFGGLVDNLIMESTDL